MDKLICLREKWGHHASYSGFDPIFDALSENTDIPLYSYFVPNNPKPEDRFYPWISLAPLIMSYFHGRQKSNNISPFIQRRHEITGARVIRYARKNPEAVVILSAGENQFGTKIVKADESVRKRIVVCLHQPPSWLRLNWGNFSALDGLGAVVCLSKDQMEFVSAVCSSPAILIRHGVCHEFFSPPENIFNSEIPRLLFVGHWLRDFETLTEAMHLVWNDHPKARLDCVIPRDYRGHPALLKLARDHRVIWHADISSEMLRDLYRKSTILFLPLIDAVANNSIVEAMACGLPVVTTGVGGVYDYVPETAGELCAPGNVGSHATAVLNWIGDQKRLEKAKIAGRIFSESELDWSHIAKKLCMGLQNLL